MFSWDQIVPDVISNGVVKRSRFRGVSRVADAGEVGLRVILIPVAEMLRHVDVLDVLLLIESIKDRIGKRVPCVHISRSDIEQPTTVSFHEV